jgi:Protein of unknown function, DUF481
MKKTLPVLVFLLFTADCLFAQQKKDTVFFNNSTIVVGKLKKIKVGVVTFDPDDANDITVQLRKLKAIHAQREIYRVESIQKEVLFGVLMPDSVPGRTRIVNTEGQKSIGLEEIINLYPFSDRFIQRFAGNIGLGYNYTRSSGYGRLNFDAALNYYSKNQEISAAASAIYSVTDSMVTRDREDISIKDNYYFSPTSFATGFLVYQRNLELGINRRYQEGLGIGNKFITRKVAYAWARTGLVFNQEKSTEEKTTGTLTEYYAQLQFNLFKFTKPEIKFDITQTFYAGITEKGRIRSDGEVNLSWEIVKDLRLTLQFYDNYDSKPPVASSSNFDYGIVFGIAYVFY